MKPNNLLRRNLPYRYYNLTVVLITLNIATYLITMLFRNTLGYLALTPRFVIQYHAYWQLVTYMFVHGGTGHILFNMLALFIFGSPLEQRLGSFEFLLYYLVAGIGAGLVSLTMNASVVGASGAIFALLLAYATLFPDSRIFIFGILPLKAPVAVLSFAALELFFQISGTRGGIAHLTHLAGLLFGYLYFVLRLGINPIQVFLRRR
jgi:membrane associated rhomboid family serine protease